MSALKSPRSVTVFAVRNRIVLYYSILVPVIFLAAGAYLVSAVTKDTREKISNQVSDMDVQLMTALNHFTDEVEQACTDVCRSDEIMSYDPVANGYEDYEKNTLQTQAKERLLTYASNSSYSDCAIIFSDETTVGKVSTGSIDALGKTGYEILCEKLGDESEAWFCDLTEPYRKVYYARRVTDHSVMLISSYLDEIQNIFHIGSSYSASTFIVSDENGRVVFSDDRFAAGDEVSEEYTALFENKDGECAVNSTYIAASLVTDCGWQAIAVCDSPKFVTLTPKSVAVVLAVGAALVIICILCGKVACAQFEGAQLVNPENEFIDPLTGRLNEYGLDEKISELVETSIVGSTYALALICVKDSERLKTTVPPHYWNDVRVKLCETAEEFFSGKRFEIGRVDDKIAVFADYSEFDLFKAHENLERGCKDLCRAFSNFTVGAKGDMKLHVSIGASIYPDHAEEFDSLLELSERALLEAEESGDDSVVIYSPEKHGEDGKAKGAARA